LWYFCFHFLFFYCNIRYYYVIENFYKLIFSLKKSINITINSGKYFLVFDLFKVRKSNIHSSPFKIETNFNTFKPNKFVNKSFFNLLVISLSIILIWKEKFHFMKLVLLKAGGEQLLAMIGTFPRYLTQHHHSSRRRR